MKHAKIYLERIKKLTHFLQPKEVFYIEKPIDLYYFTGMHFSLGQLVVGKKESYLLVDGRYSEAAKAQVALPVKPLTSDHLALLLKKKETLFFDEETISYANFKSLQKLAKQEKVALSSGSKYIKALRLIKDEDEIQKMKEGALIAYDAYLHIKDTLKVGMTEKEVALQLQIYCLRKGVEKMSFDSIIAFGKNSSLPHHSPSEAKLQENEVVLMDLGIIWQGYCTDMTRVVFFGKVDPRIVELYEVVVNSQRAALALCRPGVSLKELDLAARKVMQEAKLEKYFIHSLGHGVGLELHEFPRLKFDGKDHKVQLQPGMAITIEPGLYLPGIGGVRYEDTVIITEDGYVNLYP